MKQPNLRGFGAKSGTAQTLATAPVNMPDEVVTLCQREADAVLHSVNFAMARFGYTQLQIAQLCGWKTDSYLSEIKSGTKSLPEKRVRRFIHVTGCNLLAQYQGRQLIADRMAGKESPNDRNRAVLARMLAVAA